MSNPLLAIPNGTGIPVLLSAAQTLAGKNALVVADESLSPASVGTVSMVEISTVNITILTANPQRKGATIYNTHASTIAYIALGADATSTSYTVKLQPGAYYEAPYGFTGDIRAVGSAAGTLNLTEFE
jgi:hypothetical protein